MHSLSYTVAGRNPELFGNTTELTNIGFACYNENRLILEWKAHFEFKLGWSSNSDASRACKEFVPRLFEEDQLKKHIIDGPPGTLNYGAYILLGRSLFLLQTIYIPLKLGWPTEYEIQPTGGKAGEHTLTHGIYEVITLLQVI